VELLDWSLKRIDLGYALELVGLSGEADPHVWNAPPVRRKLRTVLEKGAKMNHMLGPIVLTDENGSNSLIDSYEAFSTNVNLYLSPTRLLYHWILSTATKDDKMQFRFNGEYYHEPMPENRKSYVVSIEEPISLGENIGDPCVLSKISFWNERRHDYELLKFSAKPVTKADQIPELKEVLLQKAYPRMMAAGMDFNYMSSNEIIGAANSLTP
jgi:hypothetical protein